MNLCITNRACQCIAQGRIDASENGSPPWAAKIGEASSWPSHHHFQTAGRDCLASSLHESKVLDHCVLRLCAVSSRLQPTASIFFISSFTKPSTPSAQIAIVLIFF